MEDIFLLTVEHAVQLSEDVLITPFLPTYKYGFGLQGIKRINVVKPDNQIIEKDADFGIPFDADVYILLIPNSQKDEIPVGSQIWIKNYSQQTISKPSIL